MVDPDTKSYQKTSTDALKNIDVLLFKNYIEKLCGFEINGKFVLYGELMCNKKIYNYAEENIANGWFIFGAMI